MLQMKNVERLDQTNRKSAKGSGLSFSTLSANNFGKMSYELQLHEYEFQISATMCFLMERNFRKHEPSLPDWNRPDSRYCRHDLGCAIAELTPSDSKGESAGGISLK